MGSEDGLSIMTKWRGFFRGSLANFILYHDQFGTLGTGEDSYLRFCEMIREIERYGRHRVVEDNNRTANEWMQSYIFDLWLLNVADIMVSRTTKWQLQDWWRQESSSIIEIERFFYGERDGKDADGRNIVNDLGNL